MKLLSQTAMVPAELVRPEVELSQLGMGSLDQIECVMTLEEELRVELPISDLRTLRTVGDVIEAVRQAAANAAAT
jgi:acyl carrier protein